MSDERPIAFRKASGVSIPTLLLGMGLAEALFDSDLVNGLQKGRVRQPSMK